MSLQVLSRSTPTRVGHLGVGRLYRISGSGESGVGMLPPQVFRLERMQASDGTGTVLLIGTLWWRVWVRGRYFSGKIENHHMAVHHVSIGEGSRLSGRHDFHLEEVDRDGAARVLGAGRIYAEFLQDNPGPAPGLT